jgi:Trk-type K+ transport system membrane component
MNKGLLKLQMFKNKKIILIPIIGFILLILIGSILLYLPISNKEPISFLDAIFISTSSVCTTGFSTVNLSEQFTLFGQVVILLITQARCFRNCNFYCVFIYNFK